MESGSRRAAKYIREKCKELETDRNQANEVPKEIVFYIPPEIKDMGPDAVRAYKKALDEGSCPIPYYSMLILGEERVGKTSLYRQLVGKTFIQNLDPTCGIENNTVETVDIKIISLKDAQKWKEVPSDSSDAFANAITDEAIKHMPEIEEKKVVEYTARADDILTGRVKELEKLMTPPPPKVKPQVRSEPEVAFVQHSRVPLEYMDIPPPKPVIPPTRAREPVVPLSTGQRSIPQTVSEVKRITTPSVKPTAPSSGAAAFAESSSLQPNKIEPSPIESKRHKVMNESNGLVLPKKTVERSKKEAKEPGVMNRRQGVSTAKNMKRRTKGDGVPELNLNTLDFAGQPEYRPMHHCFIARTAFYLVVFNAVDMAEYFLKKDQKNEIIKDHFEEVRYWIHSINAHIYPPGPEGSDGDETLTRVVLVGTHSKDCSEENLKRIDEKLDDLNKDKRCVNHLFKLKSIGLKYCNFIPVENSFDTAAKGEDYLRDSHTCDVQESIKTLSEKLPFLKEEHPIKWLNFMEHIESHQATSPVITKKELQDMAKRLDIKDPKVVIDFLHLSNKIMCLEYIPELFISEDQREKLQNLVIIYPRWMISVMRKIIELDHKRHYDNILPSSLQSLGDFGIADQNLLAQRWKEEVTDKVKLNHICSILQAYGLIVPIKSNVTEHETTEESSAPQEDKYLIPCKIPDIVITENTEHFDFTVYFDFELFLPVVVYHRLICKLVLLADGKQYFSRTQCIICDVEDLDWWIKYNSASYMLEVSFRGSDDNIEDMKKAHKHLLEVCQGSQLKGLKYRCCVHRECPSSSCKKKCFLMCAKYDKGKEMSTVSVSNGHKVLGKCCSCKKTSGVTLQNSGPSQHEESLSINNLGEVYSDVYPARSKWENIGLALKVSPGTLEAIKSKPDPDECCREMLKEWLINGPNRNYYTIANVLGSRTVGHSDLKKEIMKKC